MRLSAPHYHFFGPFRSIVITTAEPNASWRQRQARLRQLTPWFCRADARQVSDLRESDPVFSGSPTLRSSTADLKKYFSVSRRLTAHQGGRFIRLGVGT